VVNRTNTGAVNLILNYLPKSEIIVQYLKLVLTNKSLTCAYIVINLSKVSSANINDFTCVLMAFHPTRLFTARSDQ